MRDVTAIERREQRISVLHRVLRHNIRNEYMVLQGNLEFISEMTETNAREHVMAIEESASRILSFAEKARLIEQTFRVDDTRVDIDIIEAVDDAIASIHEAVAGSTIRFDHNGDGRGCTRASVPNAELVKNAFVELIENALIHGNGTESPVDVRLRPAQSGVAVTVVDDGPGIPETEIAAIQSSAETALEHGSGVGLWLARWAVDLCGGSIHFDELDGRNAVEVYLPCRRCMDES